MKQAGSLVMIVLLIFPLVIGYGCAGRSDQIKRVGMVIGTHADRIEEYKQLHADDNQGVRDLLQKYNIHNFSIYLQEISGLWYEFAYYEYTGNNYDKDMADLAAEPRNREWLKICDPMQVPLPGAEGWKVMERVYFNQ